MLFTRDLRVRDNPALAAACEQAGLVVPLFAVDARLMYAANRARFLLESLADLREGLRARGGDLAVRHGSPEAEVIRLAMQTGAQMVFVADDVSSYATRRQAALARECARHRLELRVTPGVTVVPPGELRPTGGDHYKVFTPYWHCSVSWNSLVREVTSDAAVHRVDDRTSHARGATTSPSTR